MPRGSLDVLMESESHDPMAFVRSQFPLHGFNIDTYEDYAKCAAQLSSMLEKILLAREVIWDNQPSYFLPAYWNQVLRKFLDKVPQSQEFWDVFVQLGIVERSIVRYVFKMEEVATKVFDGSLPSEKLVKYITSYTTSVLFAWNGLGGSYWHDLSQPKQSEQVVLDSMKVGEERTLSTRDVDGLKLHLVKSGPSHHRRPTNVDLFVFKLVTWYVEEHAPTADWTMSSVRIVINDPTIEHSVIGFSGNGRKPIHQAVNKLFKDITVDLQRVVKLIPLNLMALPDSNLALKLISTGQLVLAAYSESNASLSLCSTFAMLCIDVLHDALVDDLRGVFLHWFNKDRDDIYYREAEMLQESLFKVLSDKLAKHRTQYGLDKDSTYDKIIKEYLRISDKLPDKGFEVSNIIDSMKKEFLALNWDVRQYRPVLGWFEVFLNNLNDLWRDFPARYIDKQRRQLVKFCAEDTVLAAASDKLLHLEYPFSVYKVYYVSFDSTCTETGKPFCDNCKVKVRFASLAPLFLDKFGMDEVRLVTLLNSVYGTGKIKVPSALVRFDAFPNGSRRKKPTFVFDAQPETHVYF